LSLSPNLEEIDEELPSTRTVYGNSREEILRYISENDGAGAEELGEELGYTKSSIQSVAQELSGMDILVQERDGMDFQYRLSEEYCQETDITDGKSVSERLEPPKNSEEDEEFFDRESIQEKNPDLVESHLDILEVIQSETRASYTEIKDELDYSDTTLRKRAGELEDHNIIDSEMELGENGACIKEFYLSDIFLL